MAEVFWLKLLQYYNVIWTLNRYILYLKFTCNIYVLSDGQAKCTIPKQFQGDWFSMERGEDLNTIINDELFENRFYTGVCDELKNDNSSIDADGNFDSEILFLTGKLY